MEKSAQRDINRYSPGMVKEKHPYYFEKQCTIKFLYLSDDQFVIYGEEITIEKALKSLNCPWNSVMLESIGIDEDYHIEGYIVSYQILLSFIDSLDDHWDVESARKWILSYSLKIVNNEVEATREIKTTQDINRFFEWCYNNPKKVYAGTLHQHYLSLKDNGRKNFFLAQLSNFFFNAKDVNPVCKKWFKDYIPKLGKDVRNIITGNTPNARIIYTPMGGLNKGRKK